MKHERYPQFSLPFEPGDEASITPVDEVHVPDMHARNAFGRVPFPEYWGVTGDKFKEVTIDDEQRVNPKVLAEKLGDRTSRHAIRGIVFNPQEFVVIPSSIDGLVRRAGARALKGRVGLETGTSTNVPVDDRAEIALLQNKIEPLENLEKSYAAEVKNLNWLIDRIPRHFLAHGDEAAMREHAVSARSSFENLIDTVAASERWSPRDVRVAKLAQEKQLLYGSLEAKKEYWLSLCKIAKFYAIGKNGLVVNTRDQILRRLETGN